MQVDPADRLEEMARETSRLLNDRGMKLYGALPYSDVLASTRMDEIQAALDAQLRQKHSRTDVTVDKVWPSSV